MWVGAADCNGLQSAWALTENHGVGGLIPSLATNKANKMNRSQGHLRMRISLLLLGSRRGPMAERESSS